MPKVQLPLLVGAMALMAPISMPASAVVVGDGACVAGRPAVQVRVTGFKQATGTVRVAVYGERNFLTREGTLRKVKLPVRSSGQMDICLTVPGPGRYAVAVHHDLNGNRSKDRADGGGFSRNPQLSIVNLRPRFTAASFDVAGSARIVPVRLQYLQGLRIAPIHG